MPTFDADAPFKETLKPTKLPPSPPIADRKVRDLLIDYRAEAKDSNLLANEDDLKAVRAQQRLANYLAAAMIFLKENELLKEPLEKSHIKNALLGHWGTCPSLTLAYSHANLLIKKSKTPMIFVTGPGHGAPAILANLWIEGSLSRFYPEYGMDTAGVHNLVKQFSWPGGFPSHVNSQVPGQIHEGGELGYALAVSYGAVMDKPDLICTCVVGDGEAESGPTATSWHAHKFIDPAESGAVIPILNLNGYKISERTIYGCMSDDELASLFTGFGHEPLLVNCLETLDEDLSRAFVYAYTRIRHIQEKARSGSPIVKPRWPMILLRTPKGYSGPRSLHGQLIEGTYKSHQVPLPKAAKDQEEFDALDAWLKSYKVQELIDVSTANISELVTRNLPCKELRMGQNESTYQGGVDLDLPDWKDFSVLSHDASDAADKSPTESVASFLAQVVKKNPSAFRVFSPDELESNKLGGILSATSRNMQWDAETAHKGGRVIEVLSEHLCQGFAQGYTLTGRHSLFPSYESFLGIITTMMVQYAKFLKIAMGTTWRKPVPSFNYIETSTLWRQEHNGFSHQNPGFINSLLNMKGSMIRIYFPPDANTFICLMSHCLQRKNHINLMVGGKRPSPVWLNAEDALSHCKAGAGRWKFASNDDGEESPDVVLAGCGNEVTYELIAAAKELRKAVPGITIRVVNIIDLMSLCDPSAHSHGLSKEAFQALFTKDRPVIINFHGYPSAINQVLFGRKYIRNSQFSVHGYIEEGTTTTPFDLLAVNGCTRFNLAIDALQQLADNPRQGTRANPDTNTLVKYFEGCMKEHAEWTRTNGKDPAWVADDEKSDK